jgi:hypothetical protein
MNPVSKTPHANGTSGAHTLRPEVESFYHLLHGEFAGKV